jgi:hypothetical protein
MFLTARHQDLSQKKLSRSVIMTQGYQDLVSAVRIKEGIHNGKRVLRQACFLPEMKKGNLFKLMMTGWEQSIRVASDKSSQAEGPEST